MTKKEASLILSIDRDYFYKNDSRKNKKAYDMVIGMLEDPDYVKVVRLRRSEELQFPNLSSQKD